MTAIDTNVFVYALDLDEPAKQFVAQQLLELLSRTPNETIVPWQVAAEYLNNLRRRESAGRISPLKVQAHFRAAINMFTLKLPRIETFEHYFQLRSRFSLSHWDAMLLAACRDAGVSTLYSEDLSSEINYDGLLVVNPFA